MLALLNKMFKTFIDDRIELKPAGRRLVWGLVLIYALMICWMCFGPQHVIDGVETPGIQHYGRLVVLLTPFNSFVHFGQLQSWWQIFWVLGQNAVNILLLFPFILGLLALFPKLRGYRKILLTAFIMSLFIECTQLTLDALIDANRVFEIDDLWTNSLGGPLALWVYQKLSLHLKNSSQKS